MARKVIEKVPYGPFLPERKVSTDFFWGINPPIQWPYAEFERLPQKQPSDKHIKKWYNFISCFYMLRIFT